MTHIVFPEGSGCVQKPEDLMFVMKVGTVDYYETPPQNKADLIQRLRGADAVFLDHSVLEAEVIQSGPKLKFICFFGIGYGNCINVAAATKQGVTVSYTPGYGATADLFASLPNVLLTPPTTRKRLGRTCSVSRTRPLTHSEGRETPRGECRVNVVAELEKGGVPRLGGRGSSWRSRRRPYGTRGLTTASTIARGIPFTFCVPVCYRNGEMRSGFLGSGFPRFAAIVVVALLVLDGAPIVRSAEPNRGGAASPSISLRQVHMIETRDGSKLWEVRADQVEVNEREGFTVLTRVMRPIEIAFYSSQGQATCVADRATLDLTTKDVRLEGGVVARSEQGMELKTEQSRWIAASRWLQTDEAVTITRGGLGQSRTRPGSGNRPRAGSAFSRTLRHSSGRCRPGREGVALDEVASLFLCGVRSALGFFGAARPAENTSPITISADTLECNRKARAAVYRGNVAANDRARASASWRIRSSSFSTSGWRSWSGRWRSGTCGISYGDRRGVAERAEYFPVESRAVLSGHPKVWQNNDVVSGCKITLLLRDDRSQVEGCEGERVNAVLYPKRGEGAPAGGPRR